MTTVEHGSFRWRYDQMKQMNKNRKIAGWLFFIFAIGLFCIQMGYFLLRSKYYVEYADNRIFYVLNIMIVIGIVISIFLLLSINKKWKIIVSSIMTVLILLQ